MIITCEQCGTRFHLDEALLAPSGSKVRCADCRHIFTAFPPAEPKASEAPQEKDEAFVAEAVHAPESAPPGEPEPQDDELEFSDIEGLLSGDAEPGAEAAPGGDVEGLDLDLDLDLDLGPELSAEETAAPHFDTDTGDLDFSDIEGMLQEQEVASVPSDAGFDFEAPDGKPPGSGDLDLELELVGGEAEAAGPEASETVEEIDFGDFVESLETETAEGEQGADLSFEELELTLESMDTPASVTEDDAGDSGEEFDFGELDSMLESAGIGEESAPAMEAFDLDLEMDSEALPESETFEISLDEEGGSADLEGLELDLDLGDEEAPAEAQEIELTLEGPAVENDLEELELALSDFETQDQAEEIEIDLGDEAEEGVIGLEELELTAIGLEEPDTAGHGAGAPAGFDGEIDLSSETGEDTEGAHEIEDLALDLDAAIAEEIAEGTEAEEEAAESGEIPKADEAEREEEAFIMEEEEDAEGPIPLMGEPEPRPKKKVGTPVLLLLVFTLVGAGGYFLFTMRDTIDVQVPAIRAIAEKIPLVGDLLGPKAQIPAPPVITPLKETINGKFVTNKNAGKLFVITGGLRNTGEAPRRFIRVTGSLIAKGDVIAKASTVYCGNTLSNIDLSTQEMTAIEKRLSNRTGDNRINLKLDPGKTIPFMVVFSDLPENLENFTVEVAGSMGFE